MDAKDIDQQQQSQPKDVFNKTTILLSRCHTDEKAKAKKCTHCNGERQVDDPDNGGQETIEKTDLLKYSTGFVSTKMSVHDMERAQNSGFVRCGTYFYQQNMSKSCCENWQYLLNINEFKMSHSQKKVIRRFHRYLNHGNIHGDFDLGDVNVGPMDVDQESGSEQQLQQIDAKSEWDKDGGDNVKEQIIMKVKEVVERVIFTEYISKMEPAVANAIMGKIHVRHKVNYNQKQGCLQSNILILEKEKPLLNAHKEHVEKSLANVLLVEYKKEKEFDLAVDAFRTVFTGAELCFINIYLVPDAKLLYAKAKEDTKPSPKGSVFQPQTADVDPKYTRYQEYLDTHIPYLPQAQPHSVYTMEMRRAIFTEEASQLYQKYELAVHGKERCATDFNKYYCNSPVFDPNTNESIVKRPATTDPEEIDEGRESKDEGLYPGLGSFHIYHRLNGKLVAVSVVDIMNSSMSSQYFIYDLDYKFLYLGVVGAIHEIEYMKMVQKRFNANLKYYVLGSVMLNSPKYVYKLNYRPGLVLCPKSHQYVCFPNVEHKIKGYQRLPKALRSKLDYLALVEEQHDQSTGQGFVSEIDKNKADLATVDLKEWPFLYKGERFLQIQDLTEEGMAHYTPIIQRLVTELGLQTMQNTVLELKYRKKKE